MTDFDSFQSASDEIVRFGKYLWDKNLTVGSSGNMSVKLGGGSGIAITATETSLGFLTSKDIVHMDLQGRVIQGGKPSSENTLHRAVYQKILEGGAVIHVHSVFANAFFLKHGVLRPRILESRHVLGDVPVVDQKTLTVEDIGPVVDALAGHKVIHLRNHGSLARGKDLMECFMLLQALEYAAQVELLAQS
ncbi:MAG TPA: class II aldolase/adducin family protein [Candidatus Omnitrophota bacterium]|nr:class II aldolase/adducin family protein [Candidatus Omnitrophota bacterium]